jgi:fumarylacetoacetate (FAA) hydrolase family protein
MNIENFRTVTEFSCDGCLPDEGVWVGRAWLSAAIAYKGIAGPHVVGVLGGEVFDLSERFLTVSELLAGDAPVAALRAAPRRSLGDVHAMLRNSLFHQDSAADANADENENENERSARLLSPNDLAAVKACGVTFVRSLLERVIEERARGERDRANELRGLIRESLGGSLQEIQPGSERAMALKARLQTEGIWSQYLEVGIGPNAEVFTKNQPTAAVGFGAQVGVLADSAWNNPEPEVVLAVSPRGQIHGVALGNDVNLRDYEGRSALLLGEAKDQNGSCAIGPFIRLFDEDFTLHDVEQAEVSLHIAGEDGFELTDVSRMAEISRKPVSLVAQAWGANHQYPDGFMLFLGTMFAPTKDRAAAGEGFTHHVGDRVEISSPRLGRLVNWVNHCDQLPPWTFGLGAYLDFAKRRALAK